MAILSGQERILLFRVQGEDTSAWKLAYQTEHELSESREYEATATKDGTESTAGLYEGTFSATALAEQDSEKIKLLKEIVREQRPRKIEVWDIETGNADAEASTIPGEYALCNLTDIASPAPVDGNVELTLDLTIVNRPYAGEVTVTPELLSIIETIDAERGFVQPMEEA